jgi:uncharacterized protein YjbJ (UPF0337 family)
MNKDTIEGKWHEVKGQVKTKWGKLTDDDLTQINGKREELAGRLQKHYGYAKDKAEEEIASFEKSCGCASDKKTVNEEDFTRKTRV